MTFPRPALLAIALGALAPFLEIGCGDPKALPDLSSAPYAGPPVRLDASGDNYVVLLSSPTPGWVVTLDRVADQYRHKAVYLTIRRPNPTFYYPPAVVEQRIGTSVLSPEAVEVYARVLAFDSREGDQPYSFVTHSAGRP
jgi:hypothetical protein